MMDRREATAATAALLRRPTASLVLRALADFRPGLTAPELAAVAARSPSAIRAALTDLRLAGLVIRTDRRLKIRRRSKPATVWTRTA